MEYMGVVNDPYYKPPRMNQMHFESSVDEDDDEDEDYSDDEGLDEQTDFGASLETFTNSYQLELEDLIQDLNSELERVSAVVEKDGEGDGKEQVSEVDEDCISQPLQTAQVEEKVDEAALEEGIELEISSEGGSGSNEGEDEVEDLGSVGQVFSSDSDTDSVIIMKSVTDGNKVEPGGRSDDDGGVSVQGLAQPTGHARGDFDGYELSVRKAIRDLSCLTKLMVRGDGTVYTWCMYVCVCIVSMTEELRVAGKKCLYSL